MCMSSGHALSGAAAGYTSCLAYSVASGSELAWWFPHIAAGIVAGWALWCDIDTLKATVTTSLGFITRALHELVCHIAALTYYATRTNKDPADRPRIHRGITHTWPGALFMGTLVTVLCLIWPRYAEPAVLGISLHWALRGLSIPRAAHGVPKGNAAARFITTHAFTALRIVPMPGKVFDRSVRYASRKWFGLSGKWVRTSSLLICLVGAWMMTEATPELLHLGYILALGGLVAEGCLVHMLGDSVTESGICWKFPLVDKRTGKRWHESKIPVIVWRGKTYKPAFKTGRAFEIAVLYPVLLFACVLTAPGGWALLGHMGEIGTAWRHTATLSAALTLTPWPTTKPASPRTTLLAQ
jgi:hypothetical protein